ncbi:glycine--tRNA ligase subunit beta [Marinicauda salina]|uniref:glycine--tRNA ligase subunit beta n=1 Tax=Marinicauda salina TaxID=2135793 RepID=UPI0011B269F2|nr:glycine--tRNA ligase subunit beta [Marinicauda salina]
MAELLIEFFSEEIPARMQARAESDLARLVSDQLKEAGLGFGNLRTFSGPRRIGLVADKIPEKTEDVREERKGPRVGAPDKAVEGFLRGAGLSSLDQCETRSDKKGEFYVAVIEKPGRPAAEVIAEAVEYAAKNFPWPKSMKFGEGDAAQRWVRPLHRVVCLLGGEIVPATVFGIEASNLTEGHRIHSKADRVFAVKDYADYQAKLRENGVTPTRDEREAAIIEGARKVCADAGLELVEDAGLLAEVTGLVEHPVPVLGDMDPEFLDLPPEVVTLTMKVHQKYFAVRDPKTGELAPKFVVVANQDAPDGGTAIAAGNARVLSARLSDARHFWDLDVAKGLDAMAGELGAVTFHDKLGSMADKVERVAALARELAPAVGADPNLAETAARLAKADLVSRMVYEFPELQGVMGRYYALAPLGPSGHSPRKRGETSTDGGVSSPARGGGVSEADGGGLLADLSDDERAQVADAIRDHYRPQGPSDDVPTAPVSAAVALADKLDTLVGFWAIDEKPTGSKDPYALRRAALGVSRILLAGDIRISIRQTAHHWFTAHTKAQHQLSKGDKGSRQTVFCLLKANDKVLLEIDASDYDWRVVHEQYVDIVRRYHGGSSNDLLAFFADRLKVHLRDEGVRHDVIDAVFAPRVDGTVDDDLVRVTNKARALQAFLETEDGAALLTGYRRAANILKAEEKKGFDLAAARAEALHGVETPADPGLDPGESRGLPASGRDEVPDRASGASGISGGIHGPEIAAEQDAALLVAVAQTAEADEETALIAAIEGAEDVAAKALADEDFEGAMTALASLRAPVDAFFEAVVVNAENDMLRRNRLLLLSRIRAAVRAVADFDRLEG